ncbi:MAG: YciI family protein [Porticoccaceae bacterium]
MRFICMGFADPEKFGAMSEEEMSAAMEECFLYDDELRRGGHFAGGEALQGVESAVTLRYRGGNVDVTDGPYAETKEYLGGILILEARDLNHAIALISKHPGVQFGPWEIRPADEEINALISSREQSSQQSSVNSRQWSVASGR